MTRHKSGFSLTSGKNSIDLIDIAALVVFPIIAAMVFGVFTFEIQVFGGFNFSDVAFNIGNTAITYDLLIAVIMVVWILGTNEIGDRAQYEDWEYIMIAIAFLAVPAYILSGTVAGWVDGSDALRVGLWLLASIAAVWVSYTE